MAGKSRLTSDNTVQRDPEDSLDDGFDQFLAEPD